MEPQQVNSLVPLTDEEMNRRLSAPKTTPLVPLTDEEMNQRLSTQGDEFKVEKPDWATKMMMDIVERGGTEVDFTKKYTEEKQRRAFRIAAKDFINTSTLGLAKPLTNLLVKEKPEDVGENISKSIGQFGGFLTTPIKAGKAIGGLVGKGVTKILGRGGEGIAGMLAKKALESGASLGTAMAVSDITTPKEILKRFGEGALLGEVFSAAGLVNFANHPVISQALRQVGGRVLLKIAGQYPGISDPKSLVETLKQNPEAIYSELMNTYFLARGQSLNEEVRAKIFKEALSMARGRLLMTKAPIPGVDGVISKEQMPLVEPTSITGQLPVEPVAPPIPPQPTPPAPPQLPEQPSVKRPGIIKRNLSAVYQSIISRGFPLKELVKGRTLKPGEDPDRLFSYNRKVSALTEAFMKYGPSKLNPDGSFTPLGEGLDPIIENYRKSSPVKNTKEQDLDLDAYREAVRKIEDLQRPPEEGKKNIVTPGQVAEAQQTLTSLQQKYGPGTGVLENTSRRMTEFSNNVLKSAVGTLIDQAEFDRILAKNPHFAPFDEIIDAIEKHSGATSPTATKGLRKIRGVSDKLEPTISSTYARAERFIRIVENNRVKIATYNMADEAPDQVRKISPSMRPIRLTEKEAGEEKTIFRPSEKQPSPTSVPLFVNGEKKWMEVSKPIYDTLVSATPESMGFAKKVVHHILVGGASLLRRGATMTPDFMIRNLFRDQIDAGLQSNVGFVPFLSIPKAMASIMKEDASYQEFLRAGVARSGFVGKNRADIEKMYRRIGTNGKLVSYLNIFKDLEDLSSFFEKTTRVGTYRAARKSGLSALESGTVAAEATVDFSRIGRDTKSVNQVVAFMNAGLQGTDRFIRAYGDNPRGMTIKGLVTITLPSLIEYYFNNDDPDYQNLPLWDKYGFWHPAKIGHNYVRIPKPFLPGIFFGTVPQQMAEWIHHKNPNAFEGLMGSLVNATSPVDTDIVSGLLPTGLKPLIENATPQGWSFFRKRPIVPWGKTGLPPEKQFATYTTETAKLVGKGLRASPAKIENLVQGLGGGMGKYALQAGDFALKLTGLTKPDEGTAYRPTELSDIPILKGFVSQPIYYLQAQELQRFYENQHKADSWKRAYLNARGDEARKIRDEHPEIRIAPALDSFAETIAAYRKEIELTSANKKMTDEAKRISMTALAHKIISATKARNKMYDQKLGGQPD